jgi:ATP-binding cassette subfamily C protein LapB
VSNINDYQPWLEALLGVARHYGLGVSAQNLDDALAWANTADPDERIRDMAAEAGLDVRFLDVRERSPQAGDFPLILEHQGRVGIIEHGDGAGRLSVRMSGDQGLPSEIAIADLQHSTSRLLLARPSKGLADARIDEYIRPPAQGWLWDLVLREWPRYGDIVLASLAANLLALAGVLFSMQVYDRVIPAQSEPTLWVLFLGVLLAIAFEFALRLARAQTSDRVGKRIDQKMSERVFGRALRIRSNARPKSTGSFVAQLRELEQLRELITSSSIGVISDLPFVLLFLVILYLTGGVVVYVALAALPLLLLPGLLIQLPLARLSSEGLRESARRNALLVEVVEGLDDIKLQRAEARFQGQWEQVNNVAAEIALKQRGLTNALLTWVQELQGLLYAGVLLVGCYQVMKGDMTTGALVGSSILASRMISPLAQVSGVFARWQQAKAAKRGIDELMVRPVDSTPGQRFVHKTVLRGNYALASVQFRYDEQARTPALDIRSLDIAAGERIAVLGRIGSGKSTLLQVLAGLHAPDAGKLLLDDLDLSLLDPQDVRRNVGLLLQNSRLFYGSLRDNLVLGRPMACDEEILEALTLAGALPFVRSLPAGLEHVVYEGGQGLSGGQRQVLLLDEPTAALDEVSEQHFIDALGGWLGRRTLVVATHRMAMLRAVERIVVIEAGRVVMDGQKAEVLARLGRRQAAATDGAA